MKKTKFLTRMLCISLILTFTVTCFPLSSAFANDSLPVIRLSGGDRYKTSVSISMEGWQYSEDTQKYLSEYVVLAAGEGDDKFADALAGSPLAYALGAPLLLTPSGALDTGVRDEILRLGANKAVLLGGPGVISTDVENELFNMGINVERCWGSDRYGTAVDIGEKLRAIKPSSKVFLTTGEEFQYAMMIAPYASKNGIPILFSGKDSLNQATADAIKSWGINEVDIIGGIDTISLAVEYSLRGMGINVKRIYGGSLSETNINIINIYNMGTNQVAAARNDLFADGLAGASFAAKLDMPIVLTGQTSADTQIPNYLNSLTLEKAYILGGSGAVSDYIISLLRKGVSDSIIKGNTSGNINSGGLAAVKDGWIYYHNVNGGNSLYKIKTDGTEKMPLCGDAPFNINVVGDWIYYTNVVENYNIYKIRTNGTDRTKLNDDESWNVTVADNWIYYINESDGGCLYKIDVNGASKTKLNEYDSKYLDVKWDWIYYVNGDDGRIIYRMKLEDPSIVEKLENIYAWGINVSDGRIYFSNEMDLHCLYKVNTDGTDLVKLCDDTAYDIQVKGEWIYYSNASDGDKLYKIKIDGAEKTKLYDGDAYLLNIVEDYIYFIHGQEELLLYKVRTDGTGLVEVD